MAITKEVLDELLKDYKHYRAQWSTQTLSKAVIERAMQAEMTEQLGYEKSDQSNKDTENRRNGKRTKILRTEQGPLEIEIPRDRSGFFEPEIVPKH